MPSASIVMIPMRGDEEKRAELREHARPITFADWVRIACEEKLQRDRGVFLPEVDSKVSNQTTQVPIQVNNQ